MAWIESHDDIGDHQKTQKLCQQLNVSVPTAVGTVHLLWHYTLKVAWETGDLSGHLSRSISRACHWEGEPSKLISSLQECGFLDGMIVHDWVLYARELIYQRSYNKNKRSTAVKKLSYSRNTGSVSPLPNPTVPNPTKPKKESNAHPTIEESKQYFKERGASHIEGEKFFNHFSSNGWRVGGKSPMKDWQAAARNWMLRITSTTTPETEEKLRVKAQLERLQS